MSEKSKPPPPPPCLPPLLSITPVASDASPAGFKTARATFVPVQVHCAINNADIDSVRDLALAGINLNYVIYANTPLTLALLKEQYAIAHVLIDGGCDVNLPEKMPWKRHPLHLAARDGRLDLVTKMVVRGAALEVRDAGGMTPLQWAATAGHLGMVRWLVAAGADLSAVDDTGRSALFRAAERADVDAVRAMAAAGADVDVADVFGWTPLFQAVVCNNYDLVDELLALGASVHTASCSGQTALHLVAHRLADDNLLTLCRTDSNFYIRDRQVSCAASKYAVSNPGYELAIAELLLDAGADVHVTPDACGQSPLAVAAWAGNAELVGVLLAAGCDVRREAWVGEVAWPSRLAACTHTCRVLLERWEAGVVPLQQACRLVIRRTLRRDIGAKIKELPLPTKLLEFLAL